MANLLPDKLNLNNFEKPIFSLGIIILLLNYFYFNFNIKIQQVFYLIVILIFIGVFLEILKKKIFFKFHKNCNTCIYNSNSFYNIWRLIW